MTNKNKNDNEQPAPTPNPALKSLDIFVGEWEMVSPQFPVGRIKATFQWLEGGAFLIEHSGSDAVKSPPAAKLIIGRDDASETYCMLYYDNRGVSRIYQMSLNNGVWKMWRDTPGFWQRFEGTLSDDGKTIQSHWDSSPDGSHWKLDFELTYTKVG